MIKFENTQTYGWEAAIRGARAPLQSWDKSDTRRVYDDELTTYGDNANVKMYHYEIGPNDHELLLKLAKAGPDHGKALRMIGVTVDITAPVYWWHEMDQYRIGTVTNSTSLQHTGAKRDFTIDDFSVDDRIKEALTPSPPRKSKDCFPLVYTDCHEEDYKIATYGDRNYKVYRNGIIKACAFTRDYSDGRVRHNPEKELAVYQNLNGYYYVHLHDGTSSFQKRVHRLVSETWLNEYYKPGLEVNHIDGNKGNNSVENLEWVTPHENQMHKVRNGLGNETLHKRYETWKRRHSLSLSDIEKIKTMYYDEGKTQEAIANVYGVAQGTISGILLDKYSPDKELFELAFCWENGIKMLNTLRETYLETGDYTYFRAMRQIIPMSYNYLKTFSCNYAVLRNIYKQRKNHRLSEWSGDGGFCRWVESLPYSELLTEV